MPEHPRSIRLRPAPVLVACLLSLALPAVACAQGPKPREATIDIDGTERAYRILEPTDDGAALRPLVLALHGGGGSAKGLSKSDQFARLTEQHGAVVIFADGIDGTWNVARLPRANGEIPTWDDLTFLSRLIDRAVADHRVDPDRVLVSPRELPIPGTRAGDCHRDVRSTDFTDYTDCRGRFRVLADTATDLRASATDDRLRQLVIRVIGVICGSSPVRNGPTDAFLEQLPDAGNSQSAESAQSAVPLVSRRENEPRIVGLAGFVPVRATSLPGRRCSWNTRTRLPSRGNDPQISQITQIAAGGSESLPMPKRACALGERDDRRRQLVICVICVICGSSAVRSGDCRVPGTNRSLSCERSPVQTGLVTDLTDRASRVR